VTAPARFQESGPRRRDGGQALLLVTLVLFLVMLGVALVDGALLARLRATRDESRRVELDALADAAMAEALASLAANPAFAGAAPHALERGAISSRVRSLPDERREVTATAALSGEIRALRAEVDLSWRRPLVTSWSVALNVVER
jgi:hypothetical protein